METLEETAHRMEVAVRERRLFELTKAALSGMLANPDIAPDGNTALVATWVLNMAEDTLAELELREKEDTP